MAAPRCIRKNRTYHVVRRITQRRFFLRPGSKVNQILGYCLAEAAARFGIAVHGVTVMSNHIHLVVTDPERKLPWFLQRFFQLTAKALNTLWGRSENLWASGQPACIELTDAKAVLDAMVYLHANPVKAHLVTEARQWPGLSSLPFIAQQRAMRVARPRTYFVPRGEERMVGPRKDKRHRGKMPEAAALRFTVPPAWSHLAQTEWRDMLVAELKKREAAIAIKRGATKVLGRKAVLRQDPHGQPMTRDARGTLRPTVAAGNKWRRIEALQRNEAWQRAYRAAYDKLRQGLQVLFPLGTWKLAIEGHVACHPE